jgi:hypothetical protein
MRSQKRVGKKFFENWRGSQGIPWRIARGFKGIYLIFSAGLRRGQQTQAARFVSIAGLEVI